MIVQSSTACWRWHICMPAAGTLCGREHGVEAKAKYYSSAVEDYQLDMLRICQKCYGVYLRRYGSDRNADWVLLDP